MWDCVTGKRIEDNFGCIMADEMVSPLPWFLMILAFSVPSPLCTGTGQDTAMHYFNVDTLGMSSVHLLAGYSPSLLSPPSLPASLPPSLPPCLPASLPASLPPYLPPFLPSSLSPFPPLLPSSLSLPSSPSSSLSSYFSPPISLLLFLSSYFSPLSSHSATRDKDQMVSVN